MKTIIPAIALLSLAAVGASAQDNAQTSRSFDVRGFDRIDLGGCDVATVTLGATYAVTVQGRAANIDNVRVETIGSTLRIGRRNNSCNGHDRRVAIAITMPSLAAVSLSGATELTLPALDARLFEARASGASVLRIAAWRGGSARFDLSGASDATVHAVHGDALALDLSGASEFQAEGDVGRLTIGGSGASSAHTRTLSAPDMALSASGTASIQVGDAEQARIDASGMAKVTVTGQPRCTVGKSGLARVTCG